MATILGDYATNAPMDTFMETRTDRHPTDLAGLRGARFVAAIETEQGRRWAESKVKASPAATRSPRASCARTSSSTRRSSSW
jgi:phage/plasmid-associated DNA primase